MKLNVFISNPRQVDRSMEFFFIIHNDDLEHSYIAIAMINGKMLSITIHLSPIPSSIPSTPDQGDVFLSDNHPMITEKDIPLATLAIARCGFGIASTEDTIFALGKLKD